MKFNSEINYASLHEVKFVICQVIIDRPAMGLQSCHPMGTIKVSVYAWKVLTYLVISCVLAGIIGNWEFSTHQAVGCYTCSVSVKSTRNHRRMRSIDYYRMNSQGLEGSIKQQAMAKKDREKQVKAANVETRLGRSGDRETGPASWDQLISLTRRHRPRQSAGWQTVVYHNGGSCTAGYWTRFKSRWSYDSWSS